MQICVTMSDGDGDNLTTIALSCGESLLEEFCGETEESVLEALRKVLLGYGFRLDSNERLVLYNEDTEEVRY